MVGRIVLSCFVLTAVVHAQVNDRPVFDIVSVKPNISGARGGGAGFRPGRFDATNLTLRQLIAQAYDLPESRVLGADGWMTTERFDVSARFEQPVPRQIAQRMARQLLEDRFQLKVATESRVLQMFTLSLARTQPKLKASASDGQGEMSQGLVQGRYRVSARKMPVSVLIDVLEKELGTPVRDATRLDGLFDFQIEWSRDLAGGADTAAPSVFSALQEQLGLRLDSGKGPVDVLVIAHAARPSEN